jgi:hypothetical protein
MKHGAVVDGARLGGRAAPIGARCPALQERETVGVKEFAAVGRERGEIVRDAAVDRAKASQQPREGVVAALEHLFAQVVGSLTKLVVKGGNGVVLAVDRIGDGEQVALSAKKRKTSRIIKVSAAS